jgi:hypothetical protein
MLTNTAAMAAMFATIPSIFLVSLENKNMATAHKEPTPKIISWYNNEFVDDGCIWCTIIK